MIMIKCDKHRMIKMCQVLKLPVEVASQANTYCEEVLKSGKMEKSRITTKSLQVACLYIASKIYDPEQKITQYDLSFRFKISPMTIRKVYKRVCEILHIERTKVVRDNKLMK